MTFKSDPENTQGINLWLQVIHLDSQPSSHINSNWMTKLIKNQRNVILGTGEGNKCLIKGEIRTHCWVHLDGVLYWTHFLFLFLSSDVLTENPASMALLHSFHPGSKCASAEETFVVQLQKSCCGVKLGIKLCFHQRLGGTDFPSKDNALWYPPPSSYQEKLTCALGQVTNKICVKAAPHALQKDTQLFTCLLTASE